MSWSIALIENSVTINPKIAKALFEAQSYEGKFWYEEDDVHLGGTTLYFNDDHQEHMDYLTEPKFQNILKNAHVKGKICFGSLEGDNRNTYWGYEFDGQGNMFELGGSVEWYRKPQN